MASQQARSQWISSNSSDNIYYSEDILSSSETSNYQPTDTIGAKPIGLPDRLFGRIRSRTASLNQQLTSQTLKYLKRMSRQEARLNKKLNKTDSSAGKDLFASSAQQYAALENRIKSDSGNRKLIVSGEYQPYTDSLRGALTFLQQNPTLLKTTGSFSLNGVSGSGAMLAGISGKAANAEGQLQGAANQLNALQSKMQIATEAQQFMEQRKAQIQQYLNRYTHLPDGVSHLYQGYNEQLYYYKQQVKEYKDILNDPDKAFRTALGLLNKLPAFASFMKSNSMLSTAFPMPASAGTPNGGGQTTGELATRDQVLGTIQGAGTTSGSTLTSRVQQNIGSAQGQVDELRDKLNGGGSSDDPDMADFKPNMQRTKSFLRRLEFGTNLQTAHSSYFFPTTTDIGLSLGYKLNDNNRIGVGASYKIGWGNDINHINVSSQGIGLRSFLDIQLKKTFFVSGGFEYNYQQPFSSLHILKDLSSWQQSGLIGISKIISMKTKVFKKTKIQLLWDFLSYQQIPQTQPLKFRVGYVWR